MQPLTRTHIHDFDTAALQRQARRAELSDSISIDARECKEQMNRTRTGVDNFVRDTLEMIAESKEAISRSRALIAQRRDSSYSDVVGAADRSEDPRS